MYVERVKGGVISAFFKNKTKSKDSNVDYFRNLISSDQDILCIIESDASILVANDQFLNLTGLSFEECAGLNLAEIFKVVHSDNSPFDTSYVKEMKSDGYVVSDKFITPYALEIKETSSNKFICSFRSRTGDQNLVDKEIDHKETTNFDHFEMRTSLANINGFVDLIGDLEEVRVNPEGAKYLSGIHRNLEKLKTILMLESTQQDNRVSKQEIPLVDIITKISHNITADVDSFGVEVNIESELEQFTSANLDKDSLNYVLLFLITKAVSFTRKETVQIKLSENVSEGIVTIYINDLGNEIPSAVVEHLIEYGHDPYRNTDNLLDRYTEYVKVFKFLRNLSATLSVHNTADQSGFAVSIKIPVVHASTSHEGDLLMNSWIKNVLIVDDNRFTTYILKAFLKKYFQVETAFSGNEALNITQRMMNNNVVFDVVLMDLGLPKPWDGVQVTREMKSKWKAYKNVPFVIHTAYPDDDPVVVKAKAAGFYEILQKPVSKKKILNVFTDLSRKPI